MKYIRNTNYIIYIRYTLIWKNILTHYIGAIRRKKVFGRHCVLEPKSAMLLQDWHETLQPWHGNGGLPLFAK